MHSWHGITLRDWLNFTQQPMTVISKIMMAPMKKFMDKHLGNAQQEMYLRAALVGMVGSFAIMHKASASFRGWTRSAIKFVVYLGLLFGICICSVLFAMKINLRSKPTLTRNQSMVVSNTSSGTRNRQSRN